MAHFAQLDENNVVTQVIVVANEELLDETGQESEAKGIAFCQFLFGADTIWKQTSYSGKIRKHYAGIGFTYSQKLDAFVPVQPYPSWILNENSVVWEAPVPYPEESDFVYVWNENSLSWVKTDIPIRR